MCTTQLDRVEDGNFCLLTAESSFCRLLQKFALCQDLCTGSFHHSYVWSTGIRVFKTFSGREFYSLRMQLLSQWKPKDSIDRSEVFKMINARAKPWWIISRIIQISLLPCKTMKLNLIALGSQPLVSAFREWLYTSWVVTSSDQWKQQMTILLGLDT